MNASETAAALTADLDGLLVRARANFREVVPELDGFPEETTDQLVRATKRTVMAFARYLRDGGVRAEDRHMMREETHMGEDADPLLDDAQVRSLTLAMLATMRSVAPEAEDLRGWWIGFLSEALQPEPTLPPIDFDDALAALEDEGADLG